MRDLPLDLCCRRGAKLGYGRSEAEQIPTPEDPCSTNGSRLDRIQRRREFAEGRSSPQACPDECVCGRHKDVAAPNHVLLPSTAPVEESLPKPVRNSAKERAAFRAATMGLRERP